MYLASFAQYQCLAGIGSKTQIMYTTCNSEKQTNKQGVDKIRLRERCSFSLHFKTVFSVSE